jgi:hypothetical protein
MVERGISGSNVAGRGRPALHSQTRLSTSEAVAVLP